MSFQKILIAVDDSEFGDVVAKMGVELAKSLNAAVGFITVFDPSVGPRGAWGAPADRLAEMSELAARRHVVSLRKRIETVPEVYEWVEPGKPAAKIVEIAKEWPADLIVMGSHGRGKLGGLVLGNVSQAVLHEAPCPVLIVRERRPADVVLPEPSRASTASS